MMRQKMALIVALAFTWGFFFAFFPWNEYTAKWGALAAVVAGATLILAMYGHYIVPAIVKNYKVGNCKVVDGQYLICSHKYGGLVGYAWAKVIPTHPISDMDKEQRQAFLQIVMGLLAGTQFELSACFEAIKDRYGEDIIKRIENKLSFWTMIGGKNPPMSIRRRVDRHEKELEMLKSQPMILEGIYTVMAVEYGNDEYEIIRKLKNDIDALAGRFAGVGAKVVPIKGSDLFYLHRFLVIRGLAQM